MQCLRNVSNTSKGERLNCHSFLHTVNESISTEMESAHQESHSLSLSWCLGVTVFSAYSRPVEIIAKWHWSGHDFGCLSELTPASFLEDEIFGLLEFLAAAFSSPKRTPSPQRNTVLLKDGSCPRPTTAGA